MVRRFDSPPATDGIPRHPADALKFAGGFTVKISTDTYAPALVPCELYTVSPMAVTFGWHHGQIVGNRNSKGMIAYVDLLRLGRDRDIVTPRSIFVRQRMCLIRNEAGREEEAIRIFDLSTDAEIEFTALFVRGHVL